ncbi:guanine deaminase [Arthrobacter alpinus]|uniref:Guanine deaminase n=1 Tax=Arthrobacter alpinus TaxID=656366 RepID=A0A1H5KBG7_9MICC|nr:nucleoside deaminase [Arthrobacter alpinus]SEE62119.1 guanine deaminase [Arthrobacter alpinus]
MDESQRIAHYLAKAVELATDNVRNNGGPFGAIVVTEDGREFVGVNRVTANLDPTAHAEVTAIRNACQGIGDFDLSGATLYSSCEPCPMCLASSLWARVGHVYFAADRQDAADAGFDDALFYQYFDSPEHRNLMPVAQLPPGTGSAVDPFNQWRATANKTVY